MGPLGEETRVEISESALVFFLCKKWLYYANFFLLSGSSDKGSGLEILILLLYLKEISERLFLPSTFLPTLENQDTLASLSLELFLHESRRIFHFFFFKGPVPRNFFSLENTRPTMRPAQGSFI